MKNLILSLFLIFQPMLANAAWEVTAPYTNTYSASSNTFVPYATPTDLCAIVGVPNKIIRVFHVRVWGTQTTSGVNGFYLIKRSSMTVASGADVTVVTALPHDSYTGAAGSDVQVFTFAPTTVGTKVGVFRGADVFTAAPAGLATSWFDFDFGPNSGTQPAILHPNEMLALNFNGAAVPSGMVMACEFQWNEQ